MVIIKIVDSPNSMACPAFPQTTHPSKTGLVLLNWNPIPIPARASTRVSWISFASFTVTAASPDWSKSKSTRKIRLLSLGISMAFVNPAKVMSCTCTSCVIAKRSAGSVIASDAWNTVFPVPFVLPRNKTFLPGLPAFSPVHSTDSVSSYRPASTRNSSSPANWYRAKTAATESKGLPAWYPLLVAAPGAVVNTSPSRESSFT